MRIGIDIGGTKIEAVAIDEALSVLATFRGPVRPGPEGVTAGAIEAVDEVSRSAEGRVESIGIGVPGPVDFAAGRAIHPPIMPGWDDYPIRDRFEERYRVPVLVDNDVNIMALGERGAGRVVVDSGLAGSELVVLDPPDGLRDGDRVRSKEER